MNTVTEIIPAAINYEENESFQDAFKPLSAFFSAISKDGRIGATHIAVYAAMLQYRVSNGFVNPICVFSRQIMPIAKISTAETYCRCATQLSEYGYINYVPSFKRTQGSKIYFPEYM